jgi:nicotinate-nucleotide adenylyltransferase
MGERIGVLGGSFDPIHSGHLLLAEQVLEEAKLDKILFMPTYIQPFKQDREVSANEHRLAMLRLATEDHPKFGITEVELENKEISYTVVSLRKLKEEFGAGCDIVFILGTDMFINLQKWYMSDEIMRDYEILVGLRPGEAEDEAAAIRQNLENDYSARIRIMKNRRFEVSSTEIREKVKEGRSIRYLVPNKVREYIYEAALFV